MTNMEQQMSDYGHEQWLQYAIENIDNISQTLVPKTFITLVLMLTKYNLQDTFICNVWQMRYAYCTNRTLHIYEYYKKMLTL